MRLWRTSDDSVRWLVVFGLIQVLLTVLDFYRYGVGNPRWMQSCSLAIACLAAAPLQESLRKGIPWHQHLRTPNGVLAGPAFIAFLGFFLWIVING